MIHWLFFRFRVWWCGAWREVLVDDRLPTLGNKVTPFSHCKQFHLNSSQNYSCQPSGVTNVNQTIIAVWHWERNGKTRGVKIYDENDFSPRMTFHREKRSEEMKKCQPVIRSLTSWFRLEGHDTDDPRSGPSGIGFRGVHKFSQPYLVFGRMPRNPMSNVSFGL